jgi:Flp pilus assembly secretin CpaC
VDGRFRLEVVAVAQKSSDSDLSNPLRLGPIRLLPQDSIEVFLQGLSHRNDTRILARPRLALNLGSSLEVSDGMDIATLAPQRDQTLEIWKAVGFMLQVKLLEQRGDTVKAALNLQISRPRGDQRALDRSGMQTETWLTLDQLQMVGQIQARTAGFEESRIPWLGSIPLLGAFFRWNVETTADSYVYLLLRLQKLDLELGEMPGEFAE